MLSDVEVDAELGPAMSSLNDRQRAFVRAFIALGQNGFQDNGLAAKEAGYSGSPETLRVAGHRLSHDPRVQAAIMEEARKRVSLAAAVVATPVLIEIALDSKISALHRIRAAIALTDRGGMPAMSEQKITVEHTTSNERMEMLARRLAAELGIDEARLIGVNRAASEAIDAEFVEVKDPA